MISFVKQPTWEENFALPSKKLSATLRNALWIALMALVGGGASGCDIPTSGPSLETETGLQAPVVAGKTFSFLGGPEGEREPLIDTTRARFDSVFTVREEGEVFIKEEGTSLDITGLNGALSEAAASVGADTTVGEAVVQGSNLATQTIGVGPFREVNGRAGPTPEPNPASIQPIRDGTIGFPAELLAVPEFQVASVNADTIRRGTLTGETTFEEQRVNQITFTLRNDPLVPTPLTDGSGNGPVIRVLSGNGTLVGSADFPEPIQAGEAPSVTVDLSEKTIGKKSKLDLVLNGSSQDPNDELTVALSPLRYQKVTLEDNLSATVSAERQGLSTRGNGGSQFAGLVPRNGTLQLEVTNNFQFPIEVDSLVLENSSDATTVLPASFPDLRVLESEGIIQPRSSQTFEVGLKGKGIAQNIDVRFRASLDGNPDSLAASASDDIEISAAGPIGVGVLYFWPSGETVGASGEINFQQGRIRFERLEDFLELSGGRIAVENLQSDPEVAFESLKVSFPGIRENPYSAADSLSIGFSVPATGSPEDQTRSLSGVRLFPTGGSLDYSLRGTLETVARQTEETLRVVRFDDKIEVDLSVGNLEVSAVEGTVDPFAINITEDANGDGRLDLADTLEASVTSFGDFGGLGDIVQDVTLSGSVLTLDVTTDAEANVNIVAALQGRGGSEDVFLAGRNERSVAPGDSLSGDFVEGGETVGSENLIQLPVEGAFSREKVTRSLQLTDLNSTVGRFVGAFPSSLRVVAKGEITGGEKGRIRLRRPVTFDAGLGLSVPIQFESSFSVQDTLDADFSSLEDVTDPSRDVTVTDAKLRVPYENGIPLGIGARIAVLDGSGAEVLTFPEGEDRLDLRSAPTGREGTATGRQRGQLSVSLTEEETRALAKGRKVVLDLSVRPPQGSGPARLRASDPLKVSLRAEVKTQLSTGGGSK